MKTLKESLFNTDLAEKNITFSSIWKLSRIYLCISASGRGRGKLSAITNNHDAMKFITNKFVLPKLKDKTKPADLSNVNILYNVLQNPDCKEIVSYIVSMINNLPVETFESESSNPILIELFSDVLKKNAKIKFHTYKNSQNNMIEIYIQTSIPTGTIGLELRYEKR